MIELTVAVLIVVIAIAFASKGLMIIRGSEAVVVERLGSYHRTLDSGINFLIPFVDNPRPITMVRYKRNGDEFTPLSSQEIRIDRRETVLDFPGQPVVTTDNVTVRINGALYFQIIEPKQAVYEVENMSQAIEVLAKTTLRSVVGKMALDQVFESRKEINDKIQAAMEEPASKWGVKIARVEVQDISMPEEVEEAMRLQMAAERKRRATVTEAEGEKAAAIAKAQGQRESSILNAEGDKEAAILRGQGDKESIALVLSALGDSEEARKDAVRYIIAQNYIKMLPDMAKDGDRVFLPFEASALLGSVGSIQELTSPTPASAGMKAHNSLGAGMIAGAGTGTAGA